jgi:Uncharacterized protein conserved in bacteria
LLLKGGVNMYDYPLDYTWTTEEIINVISLYTAVEKAYEEGISKEEFMNCYRSYTNIVDSKSQQKQLDKEFKKVSGYSIYEVLQKAKENDWIKM